MNFASKPEALDIRTAVIENQKALRGRSLKYWIKVSDWNDLKLTSKAIYNFALHFRFSGSFGNVSSS